MTEVAALAGTVADQLDRTGRHDGCIGDQGGPRVRTDHATRWLLDGD